MKRTATIVAPLIVAVLTMAGCSAAGQAPNTEQSAAQTLARIPSAVPSGTPAPAAGPSSKETTAWAEQIREQFLDSYDRTNESQFSDDTPHQKITGWYETSPGHLLVELKGDDWQVARLRWLAIEIFERAEPDGKRLGKVTVATEHHEATRSITPHYPRG